MHKQDEDNQESSEAGKQNICPGKMTLSWLSLSEMNTLAILETEEN